MNWKQLRHDLNYVTSAGIFVVLVVAAVTGIVAHLWDLNDFIYHVYAGYALVGFAIAHVAFNWSKLINYGRWRLGRRGTRHAKPAHPRSKQPAPGTAAPQAASASAGTDRPPAAVWRQVRVSRRGAVGLVLTGIGGVVVGRRLSTPPEVPYGSDLGVVYHAWSKPGTPALWGTLADWGSQPPRYKAYPDAPYITLPKPGAVRGLPTEVAIQQRRSVRTYSGHPLTLDELSRLLYNTGSERSHQWGSPRRTAPSSGALYPIETYLIVHNVEGLASGIYHYAVEDHGLHQVRTGDFRRAIVRQGVSQGFLGTCNVVVVFTSIFQRMRWKYQQRSYRYGLLEAGHLGQNLCLAATSMGLGTCCVGAYYDHDLDAMLGIDGTDEASLYIIAAGHV